MAKVSFPKRNATSASARSGAQTNAILERLKARTLAAGSFSGACLPALGQHYLEQLGQLFAIIGRPLSGAEFEAFSATFLQKLEDGFAQSPHARFVFAYQPAPASHGVDCTLSIVCPSLEEQYREWLAGPAGDEPFGKHPDARVLALAESLGMATEIRALDAGAGSGRNALPLARLGFRVDAIEPVSELAGVLRTAAARESLAIEVLERDLLPEEPALPEGAYRLIVLSEVLPHLSAAELESLLPKLARALAPQGRLLFNAFLAEKGYTPERLATQAAPSVWSTFYTRVELAALAARAGLALVSDASCVEYERAHLPAEAWPPTPWYVNWASGHNLFAQGTGRAPIELRWLEYQKSDA